MPATKVIVVETQRHLSAWLRALVDEQPAFATSVPSLDVLVTLLQSQPAPIVVVDARGQEDEVAGLVRAAAIRGAWTIAVGDFAPPEVEFLRTCGARAILAPATSAEPWRNLLAQVISARQRLVGDGERR